MSEVVYILNLSENSIKSFSENQVILNLELQPETCFYSLINFQIGCSVLLRKHQYFVGSSTHNFKKNVYEDVSSIICFKDDILNLLLRNNVF